MSRFRPSPEQSNPILSRAWFMKSARLGSLFGWTTLALMLPATVANAQVAGQYGPRLQEIVQAYHEAGLFQGAVLVAMDDEIIYRGAVGLANEEWGIANSPETRFTVASLGKAFTGVMLLQLVEEGLLSLSDPVTKYLTEFPDSAWRQVTVEHLLHHTAAIPWPQDNWETWEFARRYELADLVALIQREELLEEPGGEFRYCNSCYHLLAAIIERVTGAVFEECLHNRILSPLGLSGTGLAYSEPVIAMRASGYERRDDGSLVNAQLQDQSYAIGAGGMYSTVDDLFRWHRALNSNELIAEESRSLIFTREQNRNGYGWSLGAYGYCGRQGLGTLALGLGGTPGFASGIARLLDDNYFIVFAGNVRQVPQIELMNDLWNTILGCDVDLPEVG
ncbi:MAG: serine hydrolase domain-containing protein [Gemmatimonadota bacterium]